MESCAMALLLALAAAPVNADERRSEIGVRGNALYISQSLADRMVGAGMLWRRDMRDDWFVLFSLDAYRYEIDDMLPVRTTAFATALGKHQAIRQSRVDWFWSAGVGVGIPSASSVAGIDEDGQPYDWHTQAGAEIHLSASLGVAYHFSEQWALVGAGRIEHQFVDLQITDRESGNTLRVESLSPVGISVSLNYRF